MPVYCYLFPTVTSFLPSKTETDEPQRNQINPLLVVEILSAYWDSIITKMLPLPTL